MVILLIIVFLQLKLAVMHQCDHFVCLYLKTWRVWFLLFPFPIPFKFQNFVNSCPAQFQQVLQKIIGCRTVLHIETKFQKVWSCKRGGYNFDPFTIKSQAKVPVKRTSNNNQSCNIKTFFSFDLLMVYIPKCKQLLRTGK